MTLEALSPLDGRYAEQSAPLRAYFSEAALIKHRIMVEARYLIALSEARVCRKLSKQERGLLAELEKGDAAACEAIKAIEDETKHDVKAVEYWLRERFRGTSLQDLSPMLHFCLTSSDVNDTAYALMLRGSLKDVLLPSLDALRSTLADLSDRYAELPMLARTHGQPASPTTLGKEFAVFLSRLDGRLSALKRCAFAAKLNGATGNYSAMRAAAPRVDWPAFAERFLFSLGLRASPLTTQVEPKDSLAELLDTLRGVNSIFTDLSRDCWLYISMGYLVQSTAKAEVGSSTMPHKVNPIDFENAEGNLELANAMLVFLSEKLTKSRLQRDLSDSTVMRNIGVAFGHSLLAWSSLLKGLGKIAPNERFLLAELDAHPEVLTEAVQCVLRMHGVEEGYERLKELSRGRELTLQELRSFIESQPLPDKEKKRLLAMSPRDYFGYAPSLARSLR
ncbi:adenylosuccinate lyase [Candidatus Woesearchaeota archaeon]|nr:adenylosuccinate lyase [Candidatus Woesearchaeota archaeon]